LLVGDLVAVELKSVEELEPSTSSRYLPAPVRDAGRASWSTSTPSPWSTAFAECSTA